MQQAQQQEQPGFSPVEEFSAAILDMADLSYDEMAISEDGTSVSYHGDSFHYELGPMYLAGSGAIRAGEYTVTIPNAADDGGTQEVTVESVEINGKRGIVVYDVYHPTSYYDEDWVCSGMLKVILTDAESHAERLKAEVARAKSGAMSTVKGLVLSLLKTSGKGQDLANLVKAVLVDLVDDARYAYVKNEDSVQPSAGAIDAARAIGEAGDSVKHTLDMSFAGACLAEILIKHPKVESFTVECTTSQEYDDNNYYTAKNINIVDVAFVDGVAKAAQEDGDDEIDPVQYADGMADQIRDESLEYDLYDGLAGPDVVDEDFEVKVSRSALKDLLEQDVIDGLAVATVVLATAKGA